VPEKKEMKDDEPKGEPLCILLVEDNAAHAELVTRSFERHRITNRIYHVADGEAALDYLWRRGIYADPQQSPRPHLILLDLRLPKINGLEVLKEIKTAPELQRIPVVILTTSEAEQDVKEAYEAHANSYLVKPVDFAKFTQLMEELGFYWLGWNHYPW
jgi:CheY-like chemotaxis protein